MERNEFALASAFALLLCGSLVMGLALAEGPTKEWAGWAQAIGSFLALGIAILVPWYIHLKERQAADLPRRRNRALLSGALVDLSGGVADLINAKALVPDDGAPAVNAANAALLSGQHEEVLRALLQAAAMLNAILGQVEVDQYNLLRPILALRDRLQAHTPELAKEANFLNKHPTVGVLTNSIPATAAIAEDLRVWIEQAQAALQE